ncbi:MAG TPA: nucleoside 2-deoxyribosyltransferase [Bryobacteraceae bacterium]|nr:nucleoside 2-deoxyribosyltransferase [Bryobacteraceae bacterium]
MPLEPLANGTNNGARPNWAPILGQWDITEASQKFRGEGQNFASGGDLFPVGLAVSNVAMQNGMCRVKIRFSASFGKTVQAGGIVLGYRSPEHSYVFAQLGAARSAYSIGEHVVGFGWRPLVATGQLQNLRSDQDYVLQVNLSGQEIKILIDTVPVLQHLLSHPLEGRQVGLIAAGSQEVSFSDFAVWSGRPRAFVVMQFAEPYDTFYDEVIRKQADAAGFEVVRIDEKAGPGVIFQDIQHEIEQAEIVIAEITPANPNVFYELGYAHALGKPTILLAQRGSQLPFDIGSFRVVFYNDTIGGKAEVERNLKKHLEAISGR